MSRFYGTRGYRLVTVYSVLAIGWFVFAFWVAPAYVASESPGKLWRAFLRFLQPPPALFYKRDLPNWWPQFSVAVLIAVFLHFSIVLILRKCDSRPARDGAVVDSRREKRMSFFLMLLSFLFLGVTVLYGPFQDYYFYLQMWYEVRAGHDPWFLVVSKDGIGPLNAYGPLFNPIAIIAGLNPLAPKLLFAYAYILFAITQIKASTANRAAKLGDYVLLIAIFWNPYPWIQIAMEGHFDILVALLCLGCVRLWIRQSDTASAMLLVSGVLIKFLPVALLPFMALDRVRIRGRFLVVAVGAIGIGIGLSYHIWGLSTFAPIKFAASRPSTDLSIFVFLRTNYSPFTYLFGPDNYDEFSPYLMTLALFSAWYWYVRARPDIEVAAVVALTTMVLFHRTGYPQYHMVPFVMAASWLARHPRNLMGRPACVIAIGSYFVWIASYEVYYYLASDGPPFYRWNTARQVIGLPSFLTGYALIFGLAVAERARTGSSS